MQKPNKYLLTLLIIALGIVSLKAQHSISIKSMPLNELLPASSVLRVFQDKEGLMWFGTQDGLCRYDGYRLTIFRSGASSPDLLTSNEITSLAEDSTGYLWIGTKKGVNLLDKSTYQLRQVDNGNLVGQDIKSIYVTSDGHIWVGTNNRLYCYNKDLTFHRIYDDSLPYTSVNSIYEDNQGTLWVLLWGSGLFRYNPETEQFIPMPAVGHYNNPFRLYQDDHQNYWLGTWGDGLFRFDPEKEGQDKYHPFPIRKHQSNYFENHFFGIVQDNQYNYIWLISSSGLHAIAYQEDHQVEEVNTDDLLGGSNNIFSDIRKDRDGNLWVGTFSEGVFLINFDETIIKNYPMTAIKEETGITANITALYEDEDGDIWVNQNRCGLGLFHPGSGEIRFYHDFPQLIELSSLKNVVGFASFRTEPDIVWVAPESEAMIYKVKKENNRVVIAGRHSLSDYSLGGGYPRKFYEDQKNNRWIVTTNGLLVMPYNQDTIIPVSFSLGEITDITEDSAGNIWVSSENSGISHVAIPNTSNVADPRITNYTQENSLLKSNNVKTILADKKGKLWLGTKEGSVITYDILSDTFEDISDSFDMIDESIFNIIADHYGHIWLLTNKRLIEYSPKTNSAKEYSATDSELLINAFLVNSYYINKEGQILCGGNKGISVFTPTAELSGASLQSRTIITDVKINNQSVFSKNNNQWLNLTEQHITFSPDDKNIEFDFSSLNYTNPHKVKYAYRLEGIDDDWVYAENRQFAIYNQLKKGRYVFQVKAMDENGIWSTNVTQLKITKRPAFYETWWAYCIYFLLFLILIRLGYIVTKYRIRLENNLKIAQIEKEKSEELTQVKLRYFTNISHDFLTPLTILSCLIDDAEMTYKGKITQFDSMRANINRLRRLLQQVLDFRKIESGNMKLKISHGDIALFIKDVCYTNFIPLMQKKRIDFSFDSSPLHIQAWFDSDKIDKIIFNLLSNAFKYTPENGSVSVQLSKQTTSGESRLVIRIKDSGVGISKEDINNIFTRFYSNKITESGNTNGIGLNLTKDLVEIHHGIIQVESEAGEGTLFTIDIPINKEAYTSAELNDKEAIIIHQKDLDICSAESSITENIAEPAKAVSGEDKSTLLLVEDNEELLLLMKNILSKDYTILTAGNGAEALEITSRNDRNIDIIISDVMMPKVDGLELCNILKKNIETSHIPVILLTAKNSTEDRIACYEAGADAYISKPFELKVLEARIHNFVSNKMKKQQKFQENKEVNIKALEYTAIDETFLMNAVSVIEEHLSNSEFDVNMFAGKLFLSKSTLYRKIKTMTGLSPVEFIRNIRLKHACQLLKDPSAAISEVAYSVGFSDPKYFTACFKAEFSMTPSEYQKTAAGTTYF